MLNKKGSHFQGLRLITRNFGILKNDSETSSTFTDNPLIPFRCNKTIRDCRVNSALKQNSPLLAGIFSCHRARCNIRAYISQTTVIFESKWKFIIGQNFTCTSTNIAYCLSCSKRHKLYIGETGRRLYERFAEHLHSIRNYDVGKSPIKKFQER